MKVIDATNVYEETAYVDAVKYDGSDEMADEKRFKVREDLTPFSPQETEIMEVKADA